MKNAYYRVERLKGNDWIRITEQTAKLSEEQATAICDEEKKKPGVAHARVVLDIAIRK